MQQLILIIHILAAISLIAFVLIQHGKGADAGAAFGSGASNTMFGSVGSTPFLVKLTAIIAAVFFATSITLTYLSGHSHHGSASPLGLSGLPAKTLQQQPIPLGESKASTSHPSHVNKIK